MVLHTRYIICAQRDWPREEQIKRKKKDSHLKASNEQKREGVEGDRDGKDRRVRGGREEKDRERERGRESEGKGEREEERRV